MISIVIPTYNGVEHLQSCFDSLMKQHINSVKCLIDIDFRIILVDNGSADNTLEFVGLNYPGIEIIKLDKNYGFAKAVNEGIKFSLLDKNVTHILLLNNDIECEESFLENMLNGFIEDNVGSVASKMLNFYNRNKIDDVGDYIKLFGSPYARGHAETDNGQYDKPEFVFGACAGAAMYKREVFERAGYFDEDFFAYYEDVDFSLRLRMFGYVCYYNPKAVCYHKRGATSSYNSGFQLMLCEQNLVSLRMKNYPFITYLKLQPLFAAARIKRYLRFVLNKEYTLLIKAVEGYLRGLMFLPKSIKKRKKLLNVVKITGRDFEKLFI
jgi:GT2 family glycosyltransferase